MADLAIRDVAKRTGLAPGTIRMWEQRHGFPRPRRTPAGYRLYSEDDVDALRRALAYRARGLSVAAAIARARETEGPSDRPSIYAAVAGLDSAARPELLRTPTLIRLSRAIEHETLAHAAAPVLFGAFQRVASFEPARRRWEALARLADVAVVFADFPEPRAPPEEPVELPIAAGDALAQEWAVIVDAPGYAACLVAWEQPGVAGDASPDGRSRRFETLWTLDPAVTRRAAQVAAGLVSRADQELGGRIRGLLADRPLALESPAPALTALANRAVAYLDRGG
jgi:MerR family transcriptional regulator, light-induced transcriptional regulator